MTVNVEIFWKEPIETANGRKILSTQKQNVTIEEGALVLTVHMEPGKFSRIPLASMAYYDVEEIKE